MVGTPAGDDLVDGVVARPDVVLDELDGGTDAVLHVGKLYEDLIASFDVPDLTYPDGGLHVLDVQGIVVALAAGFCVLCFHNRSVFAAAKPQHTVFTFYFFYFY